MVIRSGIVALAAFFIAYITMYWSHILSHQDPVVVQVSYFAGTLSVLCMSFALLISARPKSVETAFGGLDRMYRLHKYLGIAACCCFFCISRRPLARMTSLTPLRRRKLLPQRNCPGRRPCSNVLVIISV